MARKSRKLFGAKLDSKTMIDVVGASLIVQKVPELLQTWFGLDTTISKVGAVGVGYVVGSMFGRPGISNASIALAAVDLIIPALDGILPGGTSPVVNLPVPPTKKLPVGMVTKEVTMADYLTLNDYTNNPGLRQAFDTYNVY